MPALPFRALGPSMKLMLAEGRPGTTFTAASATLRPHRPTWHRSTVKDCRERLMATNWAETWARHGRGMLEESTSHSGQLQQHQAVTSHLQASWSEKPHVPGFPQACRGPKQQACILLPGSHARGHSCMHACASFPSQLAYMTVEAAACIVRSVASAHVPAAWEHGVRTSTA